MDVMKSSERVRTARRQHPFVEWINLTSFLCGWATREHMLNLQAMRLMPIDARGSAAQRTGTTSRIR
ncbi:MAG: hypothetical protein ABI218_07535 [Caldimonas sp.]